MTRFHIARSVLSNGALGASPALLTRMSTAPNAPVAVARPAAIVGGVGHVEAVDDKSLATAP